MSSRGIPPRWKNCPRFGNLVARTFIPFKVPLDDTYQSFLQPDQYFTPNMFINYARQQKINLGLWIDLTNTDRFYDKSLVENQGISYVKIKCKGHGETPVDQIRLFIGICAKFTSKNPDKIIGVHCTHGFNRTGFLICSYLVEQENWSVDAAIETFASARDPGIYKQDYINELYQKYGDPDDTPIRAPSLPAWCNEDEQYSDDQIVQQSNGSATQLNGISSDQLLEGIDGIVLVTEDEKIKTLQQTCTEMCEFRLKGFPGLQPVSMTYQNIHLIKDDYLVSWKADGNRYMMLILGRNQMYFFDRDYRVFQIFNLTFLRRNMTENLGETLLDGELVVDVVNGRQWPRYLIYDIVYCDGQNVSQHNFRERLNIIFKQVIKPRDNAKKSGQIDRNQEPIGVRIKDFCEIKDTKKFFQPKFQRDLSHEIDGLIFQPVKMPYKPGRCDLVLKWKPPSHNSVDFRLRIIEETRPGRVERYIGQLFVGSVQEPFGYIRVTNELKKYNNKIIECRYNKSTNAWEFMRERTDKSYPNGLNTAQNVLFSIQHPITQEYLLEYIESITFDRR